MKLYDHQERFLEKSPDKSLLCWDTGTGKTLTAILWAYRGSENTLFIVPKALVANWERALKQHWPDTSDKYWAIITKEGFRRDYDTFGKFDRIVVDEAHYFSGIKSQMTKALYKYTKKHKVRFMLMATATPYMSTPWNIYTLAAHLGYAWKYMDFKHEFFHEVRMGFRVVPVVKPGAEERIAELVAKIGDVVKLDDCFDVPEQVFEMELITETKAQQAAKKKIMSFNPIVRFTKEHEVASGFLPPDDYTEYDEFETGKIDRLKELCEENKKVIIVCKYTLQIKRYADALKGCGPIFVIQGDTKDRDSVVREADAADRAIVLINAACSEGYELPSFPLMVFASLGFSYKDYKQIIGRILRANKLKKNTYIHLVTSGGIDEAVYNSIMKKQDFSVKIYAQQVVA